VKKRPMESTFMDKGQLENPLCIPTGLYGGHSRAWYLAFIGNRSGNRRQPPPDCRVPIPLGRAGTHLLRSGAAVIFPRNFSDQIKDDLIHKRLCRGCALFLLYAHVAGAFRMGAKRA